MIAGILTAGIWLKFNALGCLTASRAARIATRAARARRRNSCTLALGRYREDRVLFVERGALARWAHRRARASDDGLEAGGAIAADVLKNRHGASSIVEDCG